MKPGIVGTLASVPKLSKYPSYSFDPTMTVVPELQQPAVDSALFSASSG